MKKINVLILILAMLTLGACSGNAAEPSKAQPAEEPAEAEIMVEAEAEEETGEIETESAKAVALHDYAVIEKYDRGTEIEVLCDVPGLDSYSIVRAGDKLGIMAKMFFRMDGAEEYKSWSAHAEIQAKFCTGFDMDEGTAEILPDWTPVTVLDEVGYCYVVKLADGRIGTIANDEAALYGEGGKRVRVHGDGDDIIISVNGMEPYYAAALGYEVSESDAYEGKATIICNQAPLLAGRYDYDEEVIVSKRGEEECTLLCGGVEGQVEKRFLLFPGETPYQSWKGYLAANTGGFKNIRLIGKPDMEFLFNSQITVLNDFEESYLIEFKGELFYVDHDKVGEHHFEYTPSNSHGQEWTAPKR